MDVRDIDDIKDALKADQMSRHPYLRDYTELSVLSTINEAMAIQIQYVEDRAKDAIEATSIWTATGTDLEHLVEDRGLTRQDGIRATGYLYFKCGTPAVSAITIPLGTLASAISQSGTRVFFETTAAASIPIGSTTIMVAAQAVETGTDSNVPEYYINNMAVYIAGVSRVENIAAFAGGTEEESDDDLRDRYKYAIDINGKATTSLIEQAIYDLDTVRECQVYTRSPGEIELVADSTTLTTTDTDVTDCIEEYMSAGIVSQGKKLATVTAGIITPNLTTTEAGKLHVRVESTYIASDESMTINFTDTIGAAKTATVTIPGGSVKGDVIATTMASVDFATAVTGFTYIGASDFTILCGLGTYPYMYVLPRKVLTAVSIIIKQTTTPDPDLETKVEDSVSSFLDAFYIGDDLEFSDLIQYIYMDYATKDTTKDQFVGIDQITSVVITANGSTMSSFGDTIIISDDQRIDPGTIHVTLT